MEIEFYFICWFVCLLACSLPCFRFWSWKSVDDGRIECERKRLAICWNETETLSMAWHDEIWWNQHIAVVDWNQKWGEDWKGRRRKNTKVINCVIRTIVGNWKCSLRNGQRRRILMPKQIKRLIFFRISFVFLSEQCRKSMTTTISARRNGQPLITNHSFDYYGMNGGESNCHIMQWQAGKKSSDQNMADVMWKSI